MTTEKIKATYKWSNTSVCPYCGGEWVEGTLAEGCMDCGEGTRYGY